MSQTPEQMAAFFDSRAASYDDHMHQSLGEAFDAFYAAVAQPVALTEQPVRLLDLGCGTGAELTGILERAPRAHCTCVDLSAAMLQQLAERYAAQREQLTLVQGSYLEMAFESGTYDCAVSVMTMHHLPHEPKRALYARILAALRPGGRYIEGDWYVSEAAETALLATYAKQMAEAGAGLYHIDIPFAVATQVRLLREAGFAAVEVTWAGDEKAVLVAARGEADPVQGFYDANARYEWERLQRHPMEFALTMRMLADGLPAAPARVLDVGGGPGRYAVELARQGYQVTLLDLSAGCLAFARAKAAESGVSLEATVHGNALDLSALPEAGFDAVLLMGPMYHLLEAADRERCLHEARRVLKPGGILGVSFINRYGHFFTQGPAGLVAHTEALMAEWQTGLRRDRGGGFTDAYCTHPAEVAPLLEANGFRYAAMVCTEGPRCELQAPDPPLAPAAWRTWVELNYQVARDPVVHGAAVHLFALAYRR
jgi:S-adenosylmethionine-dependent methyltransferase